MTSLGILLAFNFGLRVSEYADDGRSGHHIRYSDVSFRTAEGTAIDSKQTQKIRSCSISIRSDKTHLTGRDLFLNPNSAEERHLLNRLISWAKGSSVRPEDPFFSLINREGNIKRLTRNMVATAIKSTISSLGLNPENFSTHSVRRGAITTMKSSGENREMVLRVTGLSEKSQADRKHYDKNTPLDSGALRTVSTSHQAFGVKQLRTMYNETFEKRKGVLKRAKQ
jgi:hypothetical protein